MTVQRLDINDAETIRLAQELADRLGSSLTAAVHEALEAKLGATVHAPVKPSIDETLDRLRLLQRHWRPEFDGQDLSLTHADLLYDESGLPR